MSSIDEQERRHSSSSSSSISLRPSGILEKEPVVDSVEVSPFPAFECFASHISSSNGIQNFENSVRVGDRIVVKVKKFDAAGAYLKAICYYKRIKRDLEWLDYQLLAPLHALSRRLSIGEYRLVNVTSVSPVKVELLEVPPLTFNDLPEYFRLGSELPSKSNFWKYCPAMKQYKNHYIPNTLGFPTKSKLTFLPLDNFEEDCTETASLMRKFQDEELATYHVVQGVDLMKEPNYAAAIFEFNRAIQIYPKCTDAYVAKGAALSNQKNYEAAEKELEKALEINPDHVNAKTYLVETLMKIAASHTEKKDVEKARASYEKVLTIKADKRAKEALDSLNRKKDSPEAKRRRSSESSKKKILTPAEIKAAREQREKEKKKLEEMEAFIASLKNGK
ncbi:unnamed protein product [Auanema sp. JU1783]|nr:unnamed protein product [Auanema sp. JU1783]